MTLDWLDPNTEKTVEEVVGYLNFSSGAEDGKFLAGLNHLFDAVENHSSAGGEAADEPTWRALGRLIRDSLDARADSSPAFREVEQARRQS